MSDQVVASIVLVWVGMLLGLCIGLVSGVEITSKSIRTQAVRNGCAEWITSADGTTEFRWKPQAVEGQPKGKL